MLLLQQAMILIQSLVSYEKNGIDSLVVCRFDELKKEGLHIYKYIYIYIFYCVTNAVAKSMKCDHTNTLQKP